METKYYTVYYCSSDDGWQQSQDFNSEQEAMTFATERGEDSRCRPVKVQLRRMILVIQ